jgi:hypothetical protein
MAYRSRKQDRDQQIAGHINDSYKYSKKLSLASRVDSPELLEIRRQNPDMTWEEAIDELIKADLADLETAEEWEGTW